MNFKAPELYDPSNYACYAVTDVKENFTLNTVHPSGLREYLDYDLYDIGDKTLIAFTKINFYKTDFVYKIVSKNFTKDIQCENYEFIEDILNNNYDKNKSVFLIMRSVANFDEVISGNYVPVENERRCDLEDYAAVGFFDSNKENAPDLFDRKYWSDKNILGWTVMLSSMANIYIVKLSIIDMDDRSYKEWPGRVNSSQTFNHIMKMAYQWSILGSESWNSQDELAIRCKRAFDDWSIPEEALEQITEQEQSTVLELYFNNDDPRKSINETGNVPELFKNWYMSSIRYRTLGSLVNNYPQSIEIPTSMIDKEKSFFEKEIYNFCINNGLDVRSISPIDVLDKAYHSGPDYKEVNNSITDIIKKSTYIENIESVKEYENQKRKPVDIRNQNN